MEEEQRKAFDYSFEKNDIELFDILYKEVEKSDEIEKNKGYLIATAVRKAVSVDFLKHMFDIGFDVNYKYDVDASLSFPSLLHIASGIGIVGSKCDVKIVDFLISLGLDVNIKDNSGSTPLFYAAEYGSLEIIKELIDKGADINAINEYDENLLFPAVSNQNPDVIQFFIDKGLDIEHKNDDGQTPLFYAIWNLRNVDIVDLLIRNGGNKKTKLDPIQCAIDCDNSELLKHFYFSEYDFDIDKSDENGNSYFEKALKNSRTDVVNFFQRKKKGEQMMLACYNNTNPDSISKLVKLGYPINICFQKDNSTLLMKTAMFNWDHEVLRVLIENGADINDHDNNNRNFAHYAAENYESSVFKWVESQEEYANLLQEKDNKGNIPSYYKDHKEEF